MKRWELVVLIEGAGLMIAMVMPVTPSKTGSNWSITQLVFPEPSYVQEVLTYFVLVNLLIGVFGVGVLVWVRLQKGWG